LKSLHGRKEIVRGVCLAALSGTLFFLATPNFDLWALAWVGLVPGLFAVERATTTRRALFFGWCVGLVGNAGGFYWLAPTAERFGGLPPAAAALVFLLFCGYQALILLFFAWGTRAVRRGTALPMALVAPVVMVACEMCLPMLFPYYLAITQAWQAHVIQVADLAGPLGVTALLLMVNGAVYDLMTEGRRRLPSFAAAALILSAALGYGHLRLRQVDARRADAPRIKVGVVQPNVIFNHDTGASPEAARRRLSELQLRSAELEREGADLIVWPEAGYAPKVPRLNAGDWPEGHPHRIRRGFTRPLILGAETHDPVWRGGRAYNSALMLDEGGGFAGRYDKANLLLFGEYVPGREAFPRLVNYLPSSVGRLTAGDGAAAFTLRTADGREWRLAPLICLEDLLPAFGREVAGLRPHLLVNVTDDSWFGDTSEPWQHLALSVFRSVELRTEMVRAVNPGVTSYVDAAGRVHTRTDSSDPAARPRPPDKVLAEVALVEGGHTVYAAVGDAFGYACAAATLYLLLFSSGLGLVHERLRRVLGLTPVPSAGR
jgi:apolipoprotein N-acyltransferase